jgi:DNA-binding SARP family transcriptional activator
MTEGRDGERLSFAVLGPLVVRVGGRPTAVGGAKERTVLAVLLARHGHTVSTDHLLDVLWDAEPPRTAAKTLQAYVARLRGVLEREHTPGHASVLLTAGAGYCLPTIAEQVDAARFELLVRRAGHQAMAGDLPGASATFRVAEGLWRGDAYGEFASVPDCMVEAARLTELRSHAAEEHADVRLAAGEAGVLVAELEQLVQEQPFRERRWAQLVLALYRTGRQADALAALERVRTLLADELGVAPGPALQRLHERMFRHDPSLDGPVGWVHLPPVPPVLAGASQGVAGRGAALARLDARWNVAAAGRGGLVVVDGGDPLALAAALARHVCDDRSLVVHLELAPGAGPDELAGGLLAALGADPQAAGSHGDDAFSAVLVRLLALAAGRPLLAVVDGAGSADPACLGLLAEVAAEAQAHAVLFALVDGLGDGHHEGSAYAEAAVVDGVANLPRLLGR